mmetsp:Transcript_34801/g.55775  ORF Transcript_34801/g.55775 Transcript_34801/m.55775 type:complete len:343 (-) Transcript_34801:456-1484(-)
MQAFWSPLAEESLIALLVHRAAAMRTEVALLIFKMPPTEAIHLQNWLATMKAWRCETTLERFVAFQVDASCRMVTQLPSRKLEELTSVAVDVRNRLTAVKAFGSCAHDILQVALLVHSLTFHLPVRSTETAWQFSANRGTTFCTGIRGGLPAIAGREGHFGIQPGDQGQLTLPGLELHMLPVFDDTLGLDGTFPREVGLQMGVLQSPVDGRQQPRGGYRRGGIEDQDHGARVSITPAAQLDTSLLLEAGAPGAHGGGLIGFAHGAADGSEVPEGIQLQALGRIDPQGTVTAVQGRGLQPMHHCHVADTWRHLPPQQGLTLHREAGRRHVSGTAGRPGCARPR